jgi:hypothetical protein
MMSVQWYLIYILFYRDVVWKKVPLEVGLIHVGTGSVFVAGCHHGSVTSVSGERWRKDVPFTDPRMA